MTVRGPLTPTDERHGSRAGYRAGCRDRCCREADRRARAQERREQRRRGLPPGDPRHGSVNAYSNYSCRCALCSAGNTKKGARALSAA